MDQWWTEIWQINFYSQYPQTCFKTYKNDVYFTERSILSVCVLSCLEFSSGVTKFSWYVQVLMNVNVKTNCSYIILHSEAQNTFLTLIFLAQLSQFSQSLWFIVSVCLGALVKTDEQEVINFLLTTEIIPLCLRIMESGSELSKTVLWPDSILPSISSAVFQSVDVQATSHLHTAYCMFPLPIA